MAIHRRKEEPCYACDKKGVRDADNAAPLCPDCRKRLVKPSTSLDCTGTYRMGSGRRYCDPRDACVFHQCSPGHACYCN